MKSFINVLLIMVFALTFMCGSVYAQNKSTDNTEVTVDLKDLDSITRNKVIDMLNEQKEKTAPILPEIAKVDPATIKTWAESISGIIKTICGELNVSVNDFIKTDAGKITVFMVAYKMIGQDVRAIIFATLWIIIVLPLLLLSFRTFHMPYKVKTKDKEGHMSIEFISRYRWKDEAAKCISAVVHFVCIVVALIILLNAWVG